MIQEADAELLAHAQKLEDCRMSTIELFSLPTSGQASTASSRDASTTRSGPRHKDE